ncbi:pleckstrin homology domain-containing family A member 3 isoform X2 [Oryzias melastigma]|uniref:pleckstrin homology domain-containing family A member 3 isoform X2 n=1 Tax=Oryzias melastigma TaxID=30732 RepID=UPI00168D7AB2|nr:pleckstrin homology domain-containing family A member 3 isoform X2 [Oryzias melastigma]
MLGDAMEGILYKWTNYMTGWQPRWFVLENGVISYYDSEDDVNKGSKGSIKMSVCDIKVHPTDSTRLELIIPGEQHFYVRAVNAAERQRWLVALGSSKAGNLDGNKHVGPECLRTKMSELRLYCDLLVQQVQTIQSQYSTGNEATPSSLSAQCHVHNLHSDSGGVHEPGPPEPDARPEAYREDEEIHQSPRNLQLRQVRHAEGVCERRSKVNAAQTTNMLGQLHL